jgi:hypothetical protein
MVNDHTYFERNTVMANKKSHIGQKNVLEKLKKTLEDVGEMSIDEASSLVMNWLRETGHAVCIWTPEEFEDSELSVKQIEESMCQAGWETIEHFRIEKDEEEND